MYLGRGRSRRGPGPDRSASEGARRSVDFDDAARPRVAVAAPIMVTIALRGAWRSRCAARVAAFRGEFVVDRSDVIVLPFPRYRRRGSGSRTSPARSAGAGRTSSRSGVARRRRSACRCGSRSRRSRCGAERPITVTKSGSVGFARSSRCRGIARAWRLRAPADALGPNRTAKTGADATIGARADRTLLLGCRGRAS